MRNFLNKAIYSFGPWLLALVSFGIVLPYIALATYGFPQMEDLIVHSHVVWDGVWGTFLFYLNQSIGGRFSTVLFHSSLAGLTRYFDFNVWEWMRFASIGYFLMLIGAFSFLFKVLLPGLRWPVALVIGNLPVAFLITTLRDSEPLYSMILGIYTFSLALYAAFIGYLVIFLDRHRETPVHGLGIILLCVAFLGSHEIALGATGGALFFVFLMAVDFGRPDQSVAGTGDSPWLNRFFTLRPTFHNRHFILTFACLCVSWVAITLFQFLTPEAQARAFGKHATRSVSEAAVQAFDKLGDIVWHVLSSDRPYFILMFLFVFFVARTVSVRPFLRGANSTYLLMPIFLFLAVSYVAIVAMMIWPGGVVARMKHVLFGYAFVALSMGAIFLAHRWRMGWLDRKISNVMAVVCLGGLVTILSQDSWYRMAVTQATGSGFQYAKGVAKRMETLTQGKNQEVFIPEIGRPPFWVQNPIIHGPHQEAYYQDLLRLSTEQKKIWFTPCAFSGDPSWCHFRFNPQNGSRAEVLPPGFYKPPGQPSPKFRPKGM